MVAACKARLDRIIGNQMSPEDIRQSIAECRQAIANYDSQVEELHAAMLK